MTKLEMLQRAEVYTFELIHQCERDNDNYKEMYNRDNPIKIKLLESYWSDIFDIWDEIRELEDKDNQ